MSFSRQVQIIFFCWLIFLVILNLLDRLPHFPLHFLSWINFSLFFFLAVSSLFIAKNDRYFSENFYHFSFGFFLVTLTLLVYFIGVDYVVGDNFDSWNALIYSRMIAWTILLTGTLAFVFRYVFYKLPRWSVYLLACFFGVLSQIDFWYNALTITRFAFKLTTLQNIMHYIRTDVLALLALLAYFIVLLRKNRPNGAFLHALAVGLFLLYLCDIFDYVIALRQIDIYGVDQYFATFCLLVLGVILFLRLASLSSEGYQLREQLIFDGRYAISTPVVIRDKSTAVILSQLRQLISSQSVMLQCIFAASLILVSALSKQSIVLFKIFTMIIVLGTIWNIYVYIVSLRTKKGQILNQKFVKPTVSK
ncbi:hypothetical protein JXO59_15455 [candidate division KSB1 bacterium]|nr:hypothetical protein [candidate division KSB1 bacterium]